MDFFGVLKMFFLVAGAYASMCEIEFSQIHTKSMTSWRE
jgi:hypothetical protein